MADPSSLMLPHLAPSGDSAFPLSESQPPPMDFTDAQVDEYREQDRFLPVGLATLPRRPVLTRRLPTSRAS